MLEWTKKINQLGFLNKKTSIKTKLITTFVIRAVLILVVYLITFYFFRQSISEYEQIIKNADMANRIPSMYNLLIDDFKNYLVDSNTEYSQFQKSISEIENQVSYIQDNTKQTHRDSIAQLKGISNMFKNIKRKTTLAIEYRSNGELDKANKEFYELSGMSEFVKENIGQYISDELSYSVASRAHIFQKSMILVIASALFIIIITIMGIIHGVKLSSDTAKAILSIANHDISNDDAHISYGEEELDHLYQKFVALQWNVKEYISQLSSSENRLSTILNEMTDCVIITNGDGEIEYLNPIGKRIFGYEYDQEDFDSICSIIPNIGVFIPELISEFDSRCAINPDLKETKIVDGKFQHIACKQDGEMFPIEMGIAEAEVDGKKMYVFVVHDITEHTEVNKLKDEFISIVSHELRTPLTSIKGAVQLVGSGTLGEMPEKAQSMLKVASDNCIRLNSLINDILDVNKISQGKMEFFFETLLLTPIIEEAISNNNSYASQFDTQLRFNSNLDDVFVNVDKSRFIQVLTNLLSNAVKFSHRNDVVEVIVEKYEHSVNIKIKDNGVGIPKEFQSQIFQKFMQVDASSTRAKGGTGLGLNIAKMLIERMNGSIHFVSEENIGTTFTLVLPTFKEAKQKMDI